MIEIGTLSLHTTCTLGPCQGVTIIGDRPGHSIDISSLEVIIDEIRTDGVAVSILDNGGSPLFQNQFLVPSDTQCELGIESDMDD